MKLTFIGLNSWLLTVGDTRILIDPWLVDSLVLYSPWLFEAKHLEPTCYTPETLPPIDLLLISQSLEDHCHQPTLARLSKQIPAIVAPGAANTLKKLGYDRVIPLSSWQDYTWNDRIKITATPGAQIQGQRENGFLIKSIETDKILYYEPHLATDRATIDRLKQFGKIDTIIAPVVGQLFPLLGKVIMNSQDAFELATSLQPRWYLPTALGEISTSGILPQLTRSNGTVSEFAAMLARSSLSTQLLTPQPGETVDLTE